MRTLLYIGHSFHNKTKSNRFLVDLLATEYEVTEFYFDPYGDAFVRYTEIKGKTFDVVVCWQVLPPRWLLNRVVSFKKGIFFPMYDGAPNKGDRQWEDYQDFLVINFCKALHQICESMALNSRYIQYFPPAANDFDWGQENSVFFWNRISEININTIAKLLHSSSVEHIHIHKAIDPGCHYKKLECAWGVNITSSDWYQNKNDMLEDMKRSAIYIAPRKLEGIGMSFLEAMSLGRCVIAPNFPTMNEYIKDGVNGLLYNLDDPKPLSISSLRELQKRAYESIKDGHQEWLSRRYDILKWIKSYNPSDIAIRKANLSSSKNCPLSVNGVLPRKYFFKIPIYKLMAKISKGKRKDRYQMKAKNLQVLAAVSQKLSRK